MAVPPPLVDSQKIVGDHSPRMQHTDSWFSTSVIQYTYLRPPGSPHHQRLQRGDESFASNPLRYSLTAVRIKVNLFRQDK